MGSLTSRQNAGVEEVDISANHAYKYPPRTGNYFGSHFIMGGERFDTPQPEAYLFGENTDLNFLGCKPTPFPYPPPQANEPTKTLKSLVNIRKESLKFVRAAENLNKPDEHDGAKSTRFNIEFIFDADAKCAITIYYFCVEDFGPNGVTYTSRDPRLNSETYRYKRGSNQQFSQPLHAFEPSRHPDEDLCYNPAAAGGGAGGDVVLPIVIHCLAEEGGDEPRQSHTTIAVAERHADDSYVLKALKQKLFVDGLCYLLQEIYGIENKNNDSGKPGSGGGDNENNSTGGGADEDSDEDSEDNGSECVICMCDVRDTLILPCRHLCLCNGCADSLRYQANNCPICRAPFRALLQIRALRRSTGGGGGGANAALQQAQQGGGQGQGPPAVEGSCENIPAGYEQVSLIEALNGPSGGGGANKTGAHNNTATALVLATANQSLDAGDSPDGSAAVAAVAAAEALNSHHHHGGRYHNNKENRSTGGGRNHSATPEFRMSVLMSRDEQNSKESSASKTAQQSPPPATAVIACGDQPVASATAGAAAVLRLVNEKQQQKASRGVQHKQREQHGGGGALEQEKHQRQRQQNRQRRQQQQQQQRHKLADATGVGHHRHLNHQQKVGSDADLRDKDAAVEASLQQKQRKDSQEESDEEEEEEATDSESEKLSPLLVDAAAATLPLHMDGVNEPIDDTDTDDPEDDADTKLPGRRGAGSDSEYHTPSSEQAATALNAIYNAVVGGDNKLISRSTTSIDDQSPQSAIKAMAGGASSNGCGDSISSSAESTPQRWLHRPRGGGVAVAGGGVNAADSCASSYSSSGSTRHLLAASATTATVNSAPSAASAAAVEI